MVERTGGALIIAPSLYNPRESPYEVLEGLVVGRDNQLDEITSDLRKQGRRKGNARQHWLIHGSRGVGKSHFVALICHRVRKDSVLSNWFLPIWLSESVAYEVYSAGTFLLKVADRLVEELINRNNLKRAKELREGIEKIKVDGNDPELFEEICILLRMMAKRLEVVFLILLENFDVLLSAFAPRESREEARKIRSLLLHDNEFLLISTTSIQQQLKRLTDPQEPIFNQLRERTLLPLTEDQVESLHNNLTELGYNKRPKSSKFDQTVRFRILHRLTGGNPRSVIMSWHIFQSGVSVGEMIEGMRSLLDHHTPYFEGRLAELSPRERSIMTSMALEGHNLTLHEIAKVSRLPERSLSTQVKRLVESGHISPTYGVGGKGTVYSVADGLFRLWYQFRKARAVLEEVVRFIIYWHDPEAVESAILELQKELKDRETPLDSLCSHNSIRQLEFAKHYINSEKWRSERANLWAELGRFDSAHALKALKEGDTDAVANLCEKLLKLPNQTVEGLFAIGSLFRAVGKTEDSIRVLSRAIGINKLSSEMRSAVYWELGLAYSNQGFDDEATRSFCSATKFPEWYPDEALSLGVGYLSEKVIVKRIELTEDKLLPLVERHEDCGGITNVSSLRLWGGLIALSAICKCESLVSRLSNNLPNLSKLDNVDDRTMRSIFVCSGVVLFDHGFHKLSKIVSRNYVLDELDKSLPDPIYARSLRHFAMTLADQGNSAESLRVLNVLVENFGDKDDDFTKREVLNGFLDRSRYLFNNEDYDGCINSCLEVVSRNAGQHNDLAASALVIVSLYYSFAGEVERVFGVMNQLVSLAKDMNEANWKTLPVLFKAIMVIAPLKDVENWLEGFAGVKPHEVNTLKHLLSLVKVSVSDGRSSPAVQAYLAKVPPELRQTIADAAEKVLLDRSKNRNSKAT